MTDSILTVARWYALDCARTLSRRAASRLAGVAEAVHERLCEVAGEQSAPEVAHAYWRGRISRVLRRAYEVHAIDSWLLHELDHRLKYEPALRWDRVFSPGTTADRERRDAALDSARARGDRMRERCRRVVRLARERIHEVDAIWDGANKETARQLASERAAHEETRRDHDAILDKYTDAAQELDAIHRLSGDLYGTDPQDHETAMSVAVWMKEQIESLTADRDRLSLVCDDLRREKSDAIVRAERAERELEDERAKLRAAAFADADCGDTRPAQVIRELRADLHQRTIERDRAERHMTAIAVERDNARMRLKAIYGALGFIGDDGPDLDAYADGHCDADAPRRIADLISDRAALRFDRDRLAAELAEAQCGPTTRCPHAPNYDCGNCPSYVDDGELAGCALRPSRVLEQERSGSDG